MPPVTALRSPPLSRITGALSPVMALSSTEATPSTTSPSAGMKSPASTSTRSPLRSVRGRRPGRTCASRLGLGELLGLHVACAPCAATSACALPRPSAIASAKLANSTVNQSHTETAEDEPGRRLALCRRAPAPTAAS